MPSAPAAICSPTSSPTRWPTAAASSRRTELFTAFVPFAARWPVEVHIYPNRFVHNLVDLTDAELDGFAQIYLDVLGRFDRMYPTALPYISALHQYADTDEQREGYFHVELMSVRRSATKLKFLAGSESAMDAFISDVTPESVAAAPAGARMTDDQLRGAGPDQPDRRTHRLQPGFRAADRAARTHGGDLRARRQRRGRRAQRPGGRRRPHPARHRSR